MGFSRKAVPRVRQTGPGSKYRYKLTYPNGYVKYVRWPEQMPKEVSNPMDKQRMEKKEQIARELLKMAEFLSPSTQGTTMDTTKTSRERQAADPDFERTLRELGRVGWSYHEWWHKYDDEILALMEVQHGKDAPQKVREYRNARAAVTTALADLAGLINEAVEKKG